MKKTKISNTVESLGEGKVRITGIKVETFKETFIIPVVDVRASEESRRRAEKIQKASNYQSGSKFFRPSISVLGFSYNNSYKNQI